MLLAVAPLPQALTLRIALRRLGAGAPATETLRVWARSFLLRYEPSGAVGFAYRVRERARLGASTPQVLTATAYEQLAAVTAGAIAAAPASSSPARIRPRPRSSCSGPRSRRARAASRLARRSPGTVGGAARGAAWRSPARCASARSSL
ncbi:MAG: hypothetical protein QOJ63_2053, partial [Solirubrobacteraceae bacterium]|nr:hypothetical protein [Solirubrobacteraceae bacterium]